MNENESVTLTQADLVELAAKINSAAAEVEQEGLLKQKHGKAEIAAAIRAGGFLIEAKELVGHGGWEEWLSKHCKGISKSTAERYMRLSKASHVMDLNSANSLRQAYIAVGIIPQSSQPALAGNLDDLLLAIDESFYLLVGRLQVDFPPPNVPEAVRHLVRNYVTRLREIAARNIAVESNTNPLC